MTAAQSIALCRRLALYTEEPGHTTRTFLSVPMHDVHRELRAHMEGLGMSVGVDSVGNLRGVYPGAHGDTQRLLIGSHLDTVPRAGPFDGVLGVVLGIALMERLQGVRLPYAVEIIGFSEEEGVRFSAPFIGSRALTGTLDAALLTRRDANDVAVVEAITAFGLRPPAPESSLMQGEPIAYLEFHIEQGPVLEQLGAPLGVVDSIVGQTRLLLHFEGRANHAGTTPMYLRRDALSGVAEWILAVEREAYTTPGLVATVGRVDVEPGAGNIIPGRVSATLDVRHSSDTVRHTAVERMCRNAEAIAAIRRLQFASESCLQQDAVFMDSSLTGLLASAVQQTGFPVHRLASGAGHDAMILAPHVPSTMLFIRSPGGVSHHPDETVLESDVSAALTVGAKFLDLLADRHA